MFTCPVTAYGAQNIGAPVAILTGGANSATAYATVAPCPAGSLITVMLSIGSAFTASAVNDSAGNAYTQVLSNATNQWVSIWMSPRSKALPTGGTITATWTGAATVQLIADCMTGLLPGSAVVDKTAQANGASVSTLSISSGVLSQPNEIIRTWAHVGTTTFSEAAGFTTQTAASTAAYKTSYKIVTGTASVTYNPSWTPAAVGYVGLISLRGA